MSHYLYFFIVRTLFHCPQQPTKIGKMTDYCYCDSFEPRSMPCAPGLGFLRKIFNRKNDGMSVVIENAWQHWKEEEKLFLRNHLWQKRSIFTNIILLFSIFKLTLYCCILSFIAVVLQHCNLMRCSLLCCADLILIFVIINY